MKSTYTKDSQKTEISFTAERPLQELASLAVCHCISCPHGTMEILTPESEKHQSSF